MNAQELRKALVDLNINSRAVGIEDDELFSDQLRIEKRYEGYRVVYYFERWQTSQVREFATEERACDDLLKRVVNDQSLRLRK